MKIASTPIALQRFVAIANSATFPSWHADMSLNAFVCFAETAEAHQYLATAEVIGGLLDACEYRKRIKPLDIYVLLME